VDIKYVDEHTIFSTVVGSRAYGTNRPDSDYDQAGVMIPGPEYFLGLDRFEQFQGFPGVDKTIYDIRKALRLISDCNPNMVDLLFVPERCIKVMTPYWEKILKNRDLFVSKKARWTYAGYAHAQFERIMTHRKFLLNPLKKEPTREEFGLPATSRFPTAQLKAVVYATLGDFLVAEEKENFLDQLDDVYSNYVIPLFTRFIREDRRVLALEYLQVGIKSQANTLRALGPSYIKEEFLDEATKELQYYTAKQEWDRFVDWQKHRNKARAEMEAKFGYDCKHAMHLIRLARMCMEILKTGEVNVDRTGIDAGELIAIRDGAWSFDKVREYSEDIDDEADKLYKTSTLRKSPDINKIKDLCVEINEEYLWKKKTVFDVVTTLLHNPKG
jgi:predicted nucleotidyltransferase